MWSALLWKSIYNDVITNTADPCLIFYESNVRKISDKSVNETMIEDFLIKNCDDNTIPLQMKVKNFKPHLLWELRLYLFL